MALCEVRWFSNHLGKSVSANVLVPDIGTPPFPTLYLLHGLSDDHSSWLRRSRIESYASIYPLVVVMPDGFRGCYTDNFVGPPYGKYISQELIHFIQRTFPVKRTRVARAIGGLSMGGYGAIRIALASPGLFCSVHSHSGSFHMGHEPGPRPDAPFSMWEWYQIFGDDPRSTHHDVYALAAHCKEHSTLPRIRMDCGRSDHLIEPNRDFHHFLSEIRVPHEYEEFTGAHTWEYWDEHIQEALAFHARSLKIRKLPI
jgi:S-formylglutathione hydrolase FrmB